MNTKMYRIRIRSRHPSHDPLRRSLPRLPVKSVVRFGSTTPTSEIFKYPRGVVEINTPQAIRTSSNKRLMKEAFYQAQVYTPEFYRHQDLYNLQKGDIPMPMVRKELYGSRGRGNTLYRKYTEFREVLEQDRLNPNRIIYERYIPYNREYRMHVSRNGCFYSCRKMLKSEVPKEDRWFRNDSNSVWILEENEQFNKPENWGEIVHHCQLALESVGLDFGAFDVRVQGDKQRERGQSNPLFTIIEVNSAPSFGEITLEKYKEELPKLIMQKFKTN